MLFIVRLFPEITLKSQSVRKRWTRILTENLRVLVRRIHPNVHVEQDWDRILVKINRTDDIDNLSSLYANIEATLGATPGIANFSRVREGSFESIDDIYNCAFELWKEAVKDKTFCVRVRRVGEHNFSSIDVERYIGGGINQHAQSKGVKLKKPDITLSLEIKKDKYYIVESRIEGLGGFPMGTQDGVLSLISGGFDSTVSSYMMIQRGMKTHYCFFNLGGNDHELAVKEVAFYLWNKYSSTHKTRFISVPFEGVVAEILTKVDAAHMGVVLKRMMLRAAEVVAEKGGLQALVTGEAIAQVSSQTITNLAAIDTVTDKLVLRPLITMGKPDIIRLARDIGTEEFSSNIPEYCGVISVKPSASVKMPALEAQEALFDFKVLDKALSNTTVQMIDEVMNDKREAPSQVTTVSQAPENACIVDIRPIDERELRPLLCPNHEVIIIPFYQLSERIPKMVNNRTYLLYCEKGVMSTLHAAHLHDAGFTFVGVYRPEINP